MKSDRLRPRAPAARSINSFCLGVGRRLMVSPRGVASRVCIEGIFSMIRGLSEAERKRAVETKRQRRNMVDCFCPISLNKSPRLFYAELDERSEERHVGKECASR